MSPFPILFSLLLPSLSSNPWEARLNQGSISHFPSYSESTQILEEVIEACPSVLRKEVVGSTYEGREIHAYVLAKGGGRRMEEGRGIRGGREVRGLEGEKEVPRVLVTSLMHAREPGGLVAVLNFLAQSCTDFLENNPETLYLLENREVWAIPFVNLDGYLEIESSKNLWIRKNRRPTCSRGGADKTGVDINRNFDEHFQHISQKCSEEYAGEHAFSEPESQMIKNLVESHRFVSAMNFHSYGDMFTHPMNWARQQLLPPDDQKIFEELQEVMGYEKFGPAFKTVGYTTTGESDDWLYSKHGIIAMTPEVGPESGGFFPPSSEILPIARKNEPRIRYMVRKSGFEIHKFSIYWGGDGGFSVSLENGGLGGSEGEVRMLMFTTTMEKKVYKGLGQVERRTTKSVEFEKGEVDSIFHEYPENINLCIIEAQASQTCRCSSISSSSATPTTPFAGSALGFVWASPGEEGEGKGGERALFDPPCRLLASGQNGEKDDGSTSAESADLSSWISGKEDTPTQAIEVEKAPLATSPAPEEVNVISGSSEKKNVRTDFKPPTSSSSSPTPEGGSMSFLSLLLLVGGAMVLTLVWLGIFTRLVKRVRGGGYEEFRTEEMRELEAI